LETVQIRFQKDAVSACNEYRGATLERETLEKQKKEAKAKLDQYTETVFSKYQDRINTLLDNFGAGFRIGNTVRNYAGGTPSTNYHIVIDEVAVDIGDSKSPIGQPSFRNTLSAGDRSALAFAFFVARHQIDGDLAKKILVFDDPFSSQDRSRRACTQQLICKLAEQAAQVIVLSHDHSFLRTVWDGAADKSGRKPLQLRRMGQDTIITEWDIEHETKPNYMQQHAILKDYVLDGKGQPQQVSQTIRPIMEEYLRLTFPNQFAATEWLGDFIKKIREADESSVLKTAQGHLEQIEAINDYSKGFHHAGTTNADEPIDDAELVSYCKRVLDLIEGF
jgi:wobble nucleotide-excising tRNase